MDYFHELERRENLNLIYQSGIHINISKFEKSAEMDSTIHLKNNLISRIKNSTDIKFLKALQTIFDSLEQELFELNAEQNETIEISRKQIAEGKFKNHDQVITDMKQWLKKQ